MKISFLFMGIGSILYRFFMVESPFEPRIQLLSQVIENVVYVTIINGVDFSPVLQGFSEGHTLFTGLIILCLLKYCLKVTLRFGIIFIILQIIVQKGGPWTVVDCLLLIVLSAAQLIGSISFDYSSEAVHSESRCENKVIRLALLMGNVALVTAVRNDTYLHLTSAVLFVLLFVSKGRSLIKNQAYREISLRFSLWAACEHLKLFASAFLPAAYTATATILALLISQALYGLIERCRGTVNYHELLAKEEKLRLSFLLLRYSNASTFDAELEKFTEVFSEEAGERAGLSKVTGNGERGIGGGISIKPNKSQSLEKQGTSRAALALLEKSDGFLEGLLRAEVHAEGGRLLVAAEGLATAKARLSSFEWLRRILLGRAEERLAARFRRMAGGLLLAHEKEWRAFLGFQALLHRAASHHLRLNLYLRKTEISLERVKQMCTKIIAADAELAKQFETVRSGFAASTELFVSYLAKVRGDFAGAEAVLSRQRLRERQLLDGACEEKLYMRLGLSADGLKIDRVGFNASGLLGFTRSDLEGQRVERLVPPFFRAEHQRLSTAFVLDCFPQALLFQKKTVVLNGHGSYNACVIALKLRLEEGGLGDSGFCFEGHLRVAPAERHDLAASFVLNDRGAVLESTEGLFEDAESNSLKAEQLFEGTVGLPLTRTNNQHLYETFDPILLFDSAEPFYFYAKRVEHLYDLAVAEGTNCSNLNEMAMPLLNERQSTKSSAQREEEIEASIRSKQIIALFVLTIFFLLCLFGSEYLMVVSARTKYNNQKFAVVNFITLIQYYSGSQTLNLNLLYANLRDSYNYSNGFFNASMAESALKMQSINENLKQFNLGKHTLPTFNSKISFKESSFELQIMLVADSYLYQKFSSDPFLKGTVLDQAKLLTPAITIQSVTDYRVSIFNLMTTFVQDDLYYETLALWVSLANILVFALLALRIFWKLRQIEQYALQKRCEGTFYLKKTSDILDFMREITLEEMNIDKMSEQMHVFDKLATTESNSNNNTYVLSEASLIKDGTGRNIMNDSLNRTGFAEDMERAESKAKQQVGRTFRKANSHGSVLVAFGIFMAVFIALDVANEIINNKNKNLDEVVSLNSVLSLYKTNGYYTSRGVVLTFNTMLQKIQKGRDVSAAYYPMVQSLYAYLATFTLPVFPEVQFSEFSAFAANLTELYQAPICSYIACDPQYYDEINLNFISVINKYSANLSSLVKTASNLTEAEFAGYLSANKRYIDLVFYTEMTLRGYITELMMVYLKSYVVFMTNLYNDKMGYIFAMIALTVVGLAAFLFFIARISKEQAVFIHMIKIYREPIAEE